MRPERVNALTDGVLAIVITIAVLELPVPRGEAGFAELATLVGAYALSFVNIGVFWNKHHRTVVVGARHSSAFRPR